MHTNAEHVQNITLLAIESSCDDTAVSVISNGEILSNIVANQEVHAKFGGVVPELASRSHLKHILPVVHMALQKANTALSDLKGIAYTQGPGLLGSLLVGSSFAKGLSLSLNIPLIAVNHLEAHVLANLIEWPDMDFPFLCLLVSGGHTQIIKVNSISNMEILGRTLDDAAGEAFDKAAKMMGIPYPGGPLIDKYAQDGNPLAFNFSVGKVPNLDFSFSGFKTSVLYFIRDKMAGDATFVESNRSDLCASAQFTIVNYLMSKLQTAVKQTKINRVTIAGGVAANSSLRKALNEKAMSESWSVHVPSLEYCTDNAAMIAMAAYHKFKASQFSNLEESVYAS